MKGVLLPRTAASGTGTKSAGAGGAFSTSGPGARVVPIPGHGLRRLADVPSELPIRRATTASAIRWIPSLSVATLSLQRHVRCMGLWAKHGQQPDPDRREHASFLDPEERTARRQYLVLLPPRQPCRRWVPHRGGAVRLPLAPGVPRLRRCPGQGADGGSPTAGLIACPPPPPLGVQPPSSAPCLS